MNLKNLTDSELRKLCKKIRREIIASTKKNGGHMASNLGTVELTAVLCKIFDFPDDKLIWDVGHQSYAYKILTGRSLKDLRQENGVSGFPRPSESEYDAFIGGHSSMSISAALGLAEAMKLDGDTHHSIAVIGDGAFTGGECYEGLNNAGKSNTNFIVILNQNDMSISKNTGAMAKYLSDIRISDKYISLKRNVERILHKIPVVGRPLHNLMTGTKDVLKMVLYRSTMFENFGFSYIGPVDGHNIKDLEKALTAAKKMNRPVLVHVNTVKGKGYKAAEKNPGAFHAVPKGFSGLKPPCVSEDSFSAVFGETLMNSAHADSRICAVTAAMKHATGLKQFSDVFPDRFFDVGIAEEHAVTFCGGLAAGGKIPVCAIYSSFIQRAYDQIIQDLSIDRRKVILAIDRAGFVGDDGETHQGLFDVPMLRTIPYVEIYSPSNYSELRFCIKSAVNSEYQGVIAVRYPRGSQTRECYVETEDITELPDYVLNKSDNETLVIGYGRQFYEILSVKKALPNFDTLKLNKIFPIKLPEEILNYKKIFIFEEGMHNGGIGECIAAELAGRRFDGELKIYAVSGFVAQGTVLSQMKRFKLDSDSIKEILRDESHAP
ncbi:MAG: 1-deoxy-D-xylulose-5-phosphate synthase [Ruminococcus sp.]|jgi:1-deoxy-D-xylulose-5-phosphate synthase|nr:1-deoxy-D-xylulose-5-phosphate synthase [Ruminococcus sp.]